MIGMADIVGMAVRLEAGEEGGIEQLDNCTIVQLWHH